MAPLIKSSHVPSTLELISDFVSLNNSVLPSIKPVLVFLILTSIPKDNGVGITKPEL